MIKIRTATNEDNEQLLSLTKLTPMQGLLTLRIDRDPDFFRLLRLRGNSGVLVAEEGGRIIGCLSLTSQYAYVAGIPRRVGYAGDLKIHPDYRGSRTMFKLYSAMREYFLADDIDLVFCVVAAGNEKAFSTLCHGRCGTPKFEQAGHFLVHQILPLPFAWRSRECEVSEAREEIVPEILALCNDFNRSYHFAPLLNEDSLRSLLSQAVSESATRMLVVRRGGEAVATLCSYDTSRVKNNVVVDMPVSLRVPLRLLCAVAKILPLYAVPGIGQPLRILSVRNVAYRQGHEDAMRALLQQARRLAFRYKYSFVSMGIEKRDRLKFLVDGVPKYTVRASGLVTSLRNNRELIEGVRSGLVAEDFALV